MLSMRKLVRNKGYFYVRVYVIEYGRCVLKWVLFKFGVLF